MFADARQESMSRTLVDLRGLRFLDASGLGELIAADSAGRDGHVAVSFVRGDHPVVNRVFQLPGMEGRPSWTEAPG
jgi:anti-anti-sigma regulatory factor